MVLRTRGEGHGAHAQGHARASASRTGSFLAALCWHAMLLGMTAWLTAPAVAADDIDALLARPTSPANLALLIPHAADPRVPAHWRAALADPSRQVRAIAARLLLVNGIVAAVPDLATVLAQDADRAVALEAARALLVMGAGPVDELVLAAADHRGAGELAMAIAETRGTAAIGRLAQLRAVLTGPADLERLVAAVTAGSADALNQIAAIALTASDEELWSAVLDIAHKKSLAISTAHVRSALQSTSPPIRAYAWWHVAVTAAADRLPDDLKAVEPPESESAGVAANLAFGRELAARVAARATPKRSYPLAARQAGAPAHMPGFGVAALSGPLYGRLTKDERETLGIIKSSQPPPEEQEPDPDYPRIRTVADLPDGYVADVLAKTGCEPRAPVELAGAVISYSPRRHVQSLQWLATSLKSPCAEAARYIVAAAVLPAPPEIKAGSKVWLVLPMGGSFLQCLEGTGGSPDAKVQRLGNDGIVPPRKTRHVDPQYPAAALAKRRAGGVVVVEGIVSPAGCISSARITRGLATDFDLEALRAVSGWGFTPTLLNGRPVPVVMTVTVQFSLR